MDHVHRRDVRRTVWLPFIAVMAVVAIVGTSVFLFSGSALITPPDLPPSTLTNGIPPSISNEGVPFATKAAVGPGQAAGSAEAVRLAKALFAGGCFWSLESSFEKKYGVISAVSGYTGGSTKNPNYNTYHQGGHVEAVMVYYDPSRITYSELLEAYWKSVDPTDGGGSFYDRGPNYRPVLYYTSVAEKSTAEKSKAALASSGIFKKPVAVEIRMASTFYPAEEYHQDYSKKNTAHYESYREASGRDEFFRSTWGAAAVADTSLPPGTPGASYRKPSTAELKARLTPLQFDVTQNDGTEPAFQNEYWDQHGEGIYVDIVSGEPLFSTRDKYDSGTGWPSFTQALVPSNIVIIKDSSYGMVREEVRSVYADSHLGHVFDDGPQPTGRRFCMNSASLRFVPKSEMEAQGYGYFLKFL